MHGLYAHSFFKEGDTQLMISIMLLTRIGTYCRVELSSKLYVSCVESIHNCFFMLFLPCTGLLCAGSTVYLLTMTKHCYFFFFLKINPRW
jgi:hypothetical protein